ncbi:50S ribosomal protein L31 [Candidatus Beckwithbacteria bacterium]|nr:50S ribosomal protein L31 [Candidatus Beckwithbacteria bacterium]
MKAKIHPKYNHDTKVICACGNVFTTGSTLAEIRVDICSACHPFFTGEMKFVDTQGRVEKFQSKIKQTGKYVSKKQRRATKRMEEIDNTPKTLKDMLKGDNKKTEEVKEAKK